MVLSVHVGHFLETTEKSNVRPMAFHGLPGGMGLLFGPEYALAVSTLHMHTIGTLRYTNHDDTQLGSGPHTMSFILTLMLPGVGINTTLPWS